MAAVWSPLSYLTSKDTISQLQFGPENLLAVVSWDGSLQISNTKGDWSAKWQTSRPQLGVGWSLTDTKVYFGGAECRVSVVDCEAEKQCDLIETECEVTSLANSQRILAVGTFQGASLFDLRVGALFACNSILGRASIDLDIEPSGNALVVADVDGYCRLWDTRNLSIPVTSCKPFSSGVPALKVKLSENGSLYAVSNKESHVAIEYCGMPDRSFVFKSNRVIPEAGAPRMYPIYGLDFQANNKLTTAGGDKSIHIWDLDQRKLNRRVSFSMACMSVSYSRDGRYCAVGLSNDEWLNTPAKYNESSQAKVVVSESQ